MKTIQISDSGWGILKNFKHSLPLDNNSFEAAIFERMNLFSLYRMILDNDEYIYPIGTDFNTFIKIRNLSHYFGNTIEKFIELCFDKQSPLSIMNR